MGRSAAWYSTVADSRPTAVQALSRSRKMMPRVSYSPGARRIGVCCAAIRLTESVPSPRYDEDTRTMRPGRTIAVSIFRRRRLTGLSAWEKGTLLSTDILTKAWADPMFRSELSEEVLKHLPDHPAGIIEGLGEPDFLQPSMIFPLSWNTSVVCCASGYVYTDDPHCASIYSGGPCCY